MRTIILSLLGLGFAAMLTRKPLAYRANNTNSTIGAITIEWKAPTPFNITALPAQKMFFTIEVNKGKYITGIDREFRCNVQYGLPVTCRHLPETPDVVHLADNKRYAD